MDKPILFSAEMVRAILNGRKIQTRRVMRKQPKYANQHYDMPSWKMWDGEYPSHGVIIKCPYGQPDDHLWVRETWQVHQLDGPAGHKEFPNILYRADSSTRLLIDKCVWKYVCDEPKWRPSIYMPRWASRITLEVTGVRVERVQDISHEDVLAEGGPFGFAASSDEDFATLWDSLNAKHSWDSNPWVWVVEFKQKETS